MNNEIINNNNSIDDDKLCIICIHYEGIIQLCLKCKSLYCNDCANLVNNKCCICYRNFKKKEYINLNIYDNVFNNENDEFNNVNYQLNNENSIFPRIISIFIIPIINCSFYILILLFGFIILHILL
jgi:hypothetical protein